MKWHLLNSCVALALLTWAATGCSKAPWERMTVPPTQCATPEEVYELFLKSQSTPAERYLNPKLEGQYLVLLGCLTPEARGDLMTEFYLVLGRAKGGAEILSKHKLSAFSGTVGPSPKDRNESRIAHRRLLPPLENPGQFMKDTFDIHQGFTLLWLVKGLDDLKIDGNEAVANVHGMNSRTAVADRIRVRFRKIGDHWFIDTSPWWFPNGD